MLDSQKKDDIPRNTTDFTLEIDEELKGRKQPHPLEV